MILIAESGGTKTDWRLCHQGGVSMSFRTRGYQPMFMSSAAIVKDLSSEISDSGMEDSVLEVHFYGAGCSTKERQLIVSNALEEVFPKADVHINHDMLGAGIAAWGRDSGIVGILGTGSNACVYSKGKVIESRPSWGFLFGDEGSGADLAKHFLQAYFKDRLPSHLVKAFEEEYQKTSTEFLDHIYQSGPINKSLASYCPFLSKHINEEPIQLILQQRFQAYADAWIKIYPAYKSNKLRMIGSIPKHFERVFKSVMLGNRIDYNGLVEQPIDQLTTYHLAS